MEVLSNGVSSFFVLKKAKVVEDAGFITTQNLVAHLVFIVKYQAVVDLVVRTEKV